jgi:uncharacterized protein YicC (UPF0701 family)
VSAKKATALFLKGFLPTFERSGNRMEAVRTKKEAYQEKMKARLDELQADVEKLRAEAEASRADARVKVLEQMQRLQDKQDEASNYLEKMSKAGDDAWTHLRDGFESAWQEVSKGVGEARKRLSS